MTGPTGPWVVAAQDWPVVRSGATVSAVLPVRPTEPVFAGHYPDFPVLPGVCVVECVHRTAVATAPAAAELTAVELARFLGPVGPGDELTIELTWSEAKTGWCCSAEVRTATTRVATVRLGYQAARPEPPTPPPAPRGGGREFGIETIRELLPHRYPMLLLDRVCDLVPGETVTATKAVRGDEPWYRDGDRDRAYPPALVIESWCQAAGVLAVRDTPDLSVPAGRVLLLGSMTGVGLFGPVLPGDVLEHRVRLATAIGDTAAFAGESLVDGRVVLSVRRLMVTSRQAGELRATEGDRAR
jgi:3-hydroxymyristoyl/3-hydroxydecanoyl-(acyl carrier protein) dehydratase